MRRLVPDQGEEDLDELYASLHLPLPPPGRPHTYLGVVSSVDGAAAIGGRTGQLGGDADRRAFSALRETCDAILVGAGTVRTEDYGPPRPREASRRRRVARGLDAIPRLVVVSASLDLDPRARLFSDPGRPPTVLTVEDADRQRRARLADVAEVVSAGTGWVDLAGALRRLRATGVRWLLCEGGPRLAGGLLEAGVLDELYLTVAPVLAGGDGPRIIAGMAASPRAVELREARLHADELVLRYRVGDPPAGR